MNREAQRVPGLGWKYSISPSEKNPRWIGTHVAATGGPHYAEFVAKPALHLEKRFVTVHPVGRPRCMVTDEIF